VRKVNFRFFTLLGDFKDNVVIKHSAEFVGVSLNRSIAMFRMRVKSNSKGAANGSPHCPRKDPCFLGRLIHH
jgi:hypothetical protein